MEDGGQGRMAGELSRKKVGDNHQWSKVCSIILLDRGGCTGGAYERGTLEGGEGRSGKGKSESEGPRREG